MNLIRSRDDDEYLNQFLSSKPTCFLILGKSRSGKTTLAQKISELWNCKHVTFDKIFKEGLVKEADEYLASVRSSKPQTEGEEQTDEEEEELLDEEAEDEIEDENPKISKRDKKVNTAILNGQITGPFSVIQKNLWKGLEISDAAVTLCLEEAINSDTVLHYGYVLDDLPWKNPDEAIEKMTNFKLKPDIIIDIKISNDDIMNRRKFMKINPINGKSLINVQYDSEARSLIDSLWKKATEKDGGDEKKQEGEDDEDEDYLEDDVSKIDVGNEACPMLVDFPEIAVKSDCIVNRSLDHPENMTDELDNYHDNIKAVETKILTEHDYLKVLPVDGLDSPTLIFDQIKTILTEMSGRFINPAAIKPVILKPSEDDDELPDEMEDDQLFRTLAKLHNPGFRFKWKRSKWGRFCPVSLTEKHELIIGTPDCGVAFLGKMYVFANQASVNKFVSNPRKYLRNGPTLPKRICVSGDEMTSSEMIVEKIGELLNVQIIKPNEELKLKLEDKINLAKTDKRQSLINPCIEEVKDHLFTMKTEIFTKEMQEYELIMAGQENSDETQDAVKPEGPPSFDDIKVDANSQEVLDAIERHMKLESFNTIALTSEEIFEILPNFIKDSGENFILYNFPKTATHLKLLEDEGIIIDEFIAIKDLSDGLEYSLKNYWQTIDQSLRKEWTDAFNAKFPDTELTPDQMLPPESPEYIEYKKQNMTFENDWSGLKAFLTGRSGAMAGLRLRIEPKEIKILSANESKQETFDQIEEVVIKPIESRFDYNAWEYTGNDIQEEEEAQQAVVEIIEKEEEDLDFLPGGAGMDPQDPETLKQLVRQYGECNKYDIVELKEKSVLFPGIQDYGVMYREKLYMFRHEDNASNFIKEPTKYLPKPKEQLNIPPPRIFIIGPNACGKSYYAKAIAKKYNLFHFDFLTRLQELILSKIRHRVGPRYKEERELNRQKSINIDRVLSVLLDCDTDFRDLMQQINQVSKSLIDAGENGDSHDVVDDIKKIKEENDLEDNFGSIPEPPKLDEFLEGIIGALESEQALEPYHLEPILSDLWKKEPFKSTGFVLEGFPRHNSDVQFLEENGFLPDMTIILSAPVIDCVNRQISTQVLMYKERFTLMTILKEKLKENRQKMREDKIANRRKYMIEKTAEIKQKRINNRLQKEKLALAENAEDAEEEDEEENEDIEEVDFEIDTDVDINLEREFSEYMNEQLDDDGLLGFEEFETIEDASDRIKSELENLHEESTSSSTIVAESCDEFSIKKLVIDTSKFRKEITKNKILNSISEILPPQRRAICENPVPINNNTAEIMLNKGYAKLSPYGRMDCIAMHNNDSSLWHRFKTNQDKKLPIYYNGEIFFFDSSESKDMFCKDPIEYINNDTSVETLPLKTPIRLAIIGPPQSGKTTLANRFSKEQNLLKISLGEACRRILSFYPQSSLASRINSILLEGKVISCELQIEAVEHWLLNERARTQGYVFDGFPSTQNQVLLMEKSGIVPMDVIELTLDQDESITRAIFSKMVRTKESDNKPNQETILHDSPNIILQRYINFYDNLNFIKTFYKIQHQNWSTFEGKQNRWKLWMEVKGKVIETLNGIQQFVQNVKLEKAACIKFMAITPEQLLEMLSKKFNHLCPVALLEKGEIRDSIDSPELNFTAQYKEEFYRMADEINLNKFLKSPEKYINQQNIPKDKVVIITDPVNDPVFGSFCPVRRIQTGELIYGKPTIGAKYKNKNYIFNSIQARVDFIQKPEKYCEPNNKLPVKIPPIPKIGENVTALNKLPVLGYHEQMTAKPIISAFNAIAMIKPKIPWLSVKESALLYIACHLKAFNKNGSQYNKEKFSKKLLKISNQSDLLKYLANNMSDKYLDPCDRESGFDEKMEEFYGLRR